MEIETAWQNVAAAAMDMELGEGDYSVKVATLYAAIDMFLDYPCPDIVEQVKTGHLPTRPTISWLVYEGGRIPGIKHERSKNLEDYWNSVCELDQKIMKAPKGLDLI